MQRVPCWESTKLVGWPELIAFTPRLEGSLGVTCKVVAIWPRGHRFELWKYPLAEMQGKATYNRYLWFGPTSRAWRELSASWSLLAKKCIIYIYIHEKYIFCRLLLMGAAKKVYFSSITRDDFQVVMEFLWFSGNLMYYFIGTVVWNFGHNQSLNLWYFVKSFYWMWPNNSSRLAINLDLMWPI